MSASLLGACVGVAPRRGLCPIAKGTAKAAPMLCTEYGPNGWMDLLPPKRKKYPKFDRYIICQTDTDEIRRRPRESSLKTHISALEISDDDIFDRLRPDIDRLADLTVLWHSKCYESCTSAQKYLSAAMMAPVVLLKQGCPGQKKTSH